VTVVFRESFLRDVRKLRNQSIRDAIGECVRQVENASRLADVPNFRFLAGHPGYGR